MADPLEAAAARIAAVKIEAELMVAGSKRRPDERKHWRELWASPDFQARAAPVAEAIEAELTMGHAIDLDDLARKLAMPRDIAGVWLSLNFARGEKIRFKVTGPPQ